MSFVPNGSPPPYESEPDNVVPQPAYSYYADDELQHFYRWSSPPGIIRIMAIISIVLCVGIFACVASTLAWDTAGSVTGMPTSYNSYGGYGGYGGNYGSAGSSFGGGFGGGSYGYGILGSQNDPRKAKGFMIAMAILTFAIVLTLFIILISHHKWAHTRKFYLVFIIVSAILALFMLVATLVYLVGVNPMAQTSGSVQYYQVQTLCAQYQGPQNELFVNQYLYHYCVVDPQEAVAIVFGFLVLVCLIIMMVFAIKTRQKINAFGKDNILWRRVKVAEDPDAPQDVEDWVNNVSSNPDPVMNEYPQKFGGSRNYLNDSYDKPPESILGVEHNVPVQNSAPYYSSSEMGSSASKPKKRRAGRPHPNGKDYDTDYASSGDELDDDDNFGGEYPPINYVEDRDRYKREFDSNHQEYKSLQTELDEINKRLAEVDCELEELEESSPQYQDAMNEYNALKDKKLSGDYQEKKKRCKYLKAKLNHIKRMVNDFDSNK